MHACMHACLLARLLACLLACLLVHDLKAEGGHQRYVAPQKRGAAERPKAQPGAVFRAAAGPLPTSHGSERCEEAVRASSAARNVRGAADSIMIVNGPWRAVGAVGARRRPARRVASTWDG